MAGDFTTIQEFITWSDANPTALLYHPDDDNKSVRELNIPEDYNRITNKLVGSVRTYNVVVAAVGYDITTLYTNADAAWAAKSW